MPRRKPSKDLTKEEAVKRLFPKKVVDEANRVAHEKDSPDRNLASMKEV